MTRNRNDALRMLRDLGFQPSHHSAPQFRFGSWLLAFEPTRQFRTVCFRKDTEDARQPTLVGRIAGVERTPESDRRKHWHFRYAVSCECCLAMLLVRLANL